ncbi:uncharacterized protein PB18E9.04c-like [Asterias rubens]|uniref:uncharacterized protein PB18E9.04c-like n=1 Tax=Asterias rubens TaxID=7604 RepID=UPI0014553879|nr:uncharacterized protein PB18E9.04c-like [Asterias rubens]
MMAQRRMFVHLLLLCVWCIDTKFKGANAQNVTISKVQPIDDPAEGGSVDLRCNATNLTPGDFIEWSRLNMNAEVIIRPSFATTKYTQYTETSSEQSLVQRFKINILTRIDTGLYYCTVKNSDGTVEETASIYVTVRYPPSAEYPLCYPNGPLTVQEGTTQQFNCITERAPLVSMLILKNGLVIPTESLLGNATTFTKSHTFTFTGDDNGTSVKCKIISVPYFQRNCTFGPITVTMRDQDSQQQPTLGNSTTPQTDATSESSDTGYPMWTESTTGSSRQIINQTTPEESVNTSTPIQETPTPSAPSSRTSNPSTPTIQETVNTSTPSQPTPTPSTPSRQETSKPPTASQETPNLPTIGLPIVLKALIAGGLISLLILLIIVLCCCYYKKKQKPRQPHINLPLFQPTTDLVFEPQGIHHIIRKESTNLDKDDMTEKDDSSEGFCADQKPTPEFMSQFMVSPSPTNEPEGNQSKSIKSGTSPSPADVDKNIINTFTSQPELTPVDKDESKEAHGEVLRPDEPHKTKPPTGEIVYSDEVSIQQGVPQVSSACTTYADLDLSPCTSATLPLPKEDQTLYAQMTNL